MDVVSTLNVPENERFAFWREVTSNTWVSLAAQCDSQLESRFQARVGIRELGPVRTTLMTTTPHSVRRTPKLIRQDDPEVYLVTCPVHGRGMVGEQDGRHAVHRIGDLGLYDSSRPYLTGLVHGDAASRLLVLQFPRSLLPLPPRDLGRLTGVCIPGDQAVGALSSQFLLQLARHFDEFSAADTARLSTLALDVLTVALAHELDARGAVPIQTRQRALLAQIHAFIRANLGDAHLTPGAIASANGVSLRYLHKLFQQDERTVSGWIRERRLEQCRRDLADPRLSVHSITAIGARWGFTSPAHFSQAFRAAYGLSPSRFRRQCAEVHPN